MQPDEDQQRAGAYPYASEHAPAAGWPPAGAPPGGYPAPVAASPVRRIRAWLVVLVAFLGELVLIAGGDNQWSSRKIADSIGTGQGLGSNAARSWLVFRWRFGAQSGDTFHAWVAELALVGTVLVLTALLVWAIARGTAGVGRVFLGTWLAVVVAAQLAVVVAGVVVDPQFYGYQANRLNAAVFGAVPHARTVDLPAGRIPSIPRFRIEAAAIGGPDGSSLVAGLGLGLLVALAAAVAALIGRRTVGAVVPTGAGYVPAEDAERERGFFGTDSDYSEPTGAGTQHTAQLPRMGDPYARPPGGSVPGRPGEGEATTQLPPVEAPPYAREQPTDRPYGEPSPHRPYGEPPPDRSYGGAPSTERPYGEPPRDRSYGGAPSTERSYGGAPSTDDTSQLRPVQPDPYRGSGEPDASQREGEPPA